jgi:uncharacterized membrane protein HdeD (DUF308 family)
MNYLKMIGLDFYKCLKYSSVANLIFVLLTGIISLIVSKANLISTLGSIKTALFLIGSLGLIIGAVSIMKKSRQKELVWIEQWKKKFKVFSYRLTIIIMSIITILYGCIFDEILFKLSH